MEFDAIVLGLSVSGLGVLQSLGERGVKLAAIGTSRFEIGCFSRFGEKIICPDNELLNLLLEFGKSSDKKIIIYPTSDEYLLFLSRHEKIIGRYFHFPFPPNSLVEQLLNKYDFYLLASKYTDQIPKCLALNSVNSQNWKDWPAIIKPVYIHKFRQHFPNQKALIVQNEREFCEKKMLLDHLAIEAFLQEIVKGKDHEQYSVCVYIDQDKKPLEIMVSRKVRQSPLGFGVGTYVELIHDRTLVPRTLSLLKSIDFTGIAEVEYRKDERDNQYKLIEINARVWSQCKLSSYSGRDIIGSSYVDLTNDLIKPLGNNAKKWVFLLRDLQTCFYYLKQGELGIFDIVNSYFNINQTVGAIWCKKDLPVLVGILPYLMWKLRS